MKKFLLILFFIPTFLSAYAQNDGRVPVIIRIDSLNRHFLWFKSLNPFNSTDIDTMSGIESYIKSELLDILNDKSYVQDKYEQLIQIPFARTADDSIVIYFWDQNTGGSYHAMSTIIYYKLPTGVKKAEESDFDIGFDEVHTYKDSNGTHYAFMGGGIGCNTCQYVKTFVFHLNKQGLIQEYQNEISYRTDDLLEYRFNPGSESIEYKYIPDDMNGLMSDNDKKNNDTTDVIESQNSINRETTHNDTIKGRYRIGHHIPYEVDGCRGDFKDEKKQGKWICYDIKGNIIKEEWYKSGELTQEKKK